MIRLLHLTDTFYPWGGGEIFFNEFLRNLDTSKVQFVCSLVTGEYSKIDLPIPIHRLSDVNLDEIKKDIDGVVWWGRVGKAITNFLDIRVRVLMAHSSFNVDWFLHEASCHTTHCIAVSEVVKNAVGIHPCKTIWCGVDFDRFESCVDRSSLRSLLGFEAEDFVVGFFCRMGPYKNPEKAVRAVAETDAKLLLIGNGPELTNVLELCESIMPGRFQHLYYVPVYQMADFYRAVDAVMLTSVAEGCPRVVWEAMRFRAPLIGASVGMIPEVVQHKRNGLIADTREEFSDAIRFLMSDEDGRQNIVSEACSSASMGSIRHTVDDFTIYMTSLVRRDLLL